MPGLGCCNMIWENQLGLSSLLHSSFLRCASYVDLSEAAWNSGRARKQGVASMFRLGNAFDISEELRAPARPQFSRMEKRVRAARAKKNRASKRAVRSNKSSRFIEQPLTRLLGMTSSVSC